MCPQIGNYFPRLNTNSKDILSYHYPNYKTGMAMNFQIKATIQNF